MDVVTKAFACAPTPNRLPALGGHACTWMLQHYNRIHGLWCKTVAQLLTLPPRCCRLVAGVQGGLGGPGCVAQAVQAMASGLPAAWPEHHGPAAGTAAARAQQHWQMEERLREGHPPEQRQLQHQQLQLQQQAGRSPPSPAAETPLATRQAPCLALDGGGPADLGLPHSGAWQVPTPSAPHSLFKVPTAANITPAMRQRLRDQQEPEAPRPQPRHGTQQQAASEPPPAEKLLLPHHRPAVASEPSAAAAAAALQPALTARPRSVALPAAGAVPGDRATPKLDATPEALVVGGGAGAKRRRLVLADTPTPEPVQAPRMAAAPSVTQHQQQRGAGPGPGPGPGGDKGPEWDSNVGQGPSQSLFARRGRLKLAAGGGAAQPHTNEAAKAALPGPGPGPGPGAGPAGGAQPLQRPPLRPPAPAVPPPAQRPSGAVLHKKRCGC